MYIVNLYTVYKWYTVYKPSKLSISESMIIPNPLRMIQYRVGKWHVYLCEFFFPLSKAIMKRTN